MFHPRPETDPFFPLTWGAQTWVKKAGSMVPGGIRLSRPRDRALCDLNGRSSTDVPLLWVTRIIASIVVRIRSANMSVPGRVAREAVRRGSTQTPGRRLEWILLAYPLAQTQTTFWVGPAGLGGAVHPAVSAVKVANRGGQDRPAAHGNTDLPV